MLQVKEKFLYDIFAQLIGVFSFGLKMLFILF